MKLFFLFIAAVLILIAANPSEYATTPGEKENLQPCCNQNKCSEKENPVEPDAFSLFSIQSI